MPKDLYPCPYIEDGYTAPFYLAGVERLYGPLRGVMRPMIAKERARLNAYIYGQDREAGDRKAEEAIAAHIVEWDLRDRTGCPVAVSPAAVERLHPLLGERLFLVVSGSLPDDSNQEKQGSEENDVKN